MQKYATTLGDSHLLKSAEMMIGAGDLMLGDKRYGEAWRADAVGCGRFKRRDRVKIRAAVDFVLAANYLYCGQWEETVQHFRQTIDVLGSLPTVVVYPYSCLTTSLLRRADFKQLRPSESRPVGAAALMDDHGPYAASMWLSKAVELAGHDEQDGWRCVEP